jgi:putative oxidoreductase
MREGSMSDRFSAYQPQLLSLLRIVTGLLFVSHGMPSMAGKPSTLAVP